MIGMIKTQKRLGEALVDKGLISQEQLKAALQEQVRTKEFLGAILLRKKVIREEDFLNILSEQFNMSFVSLENKYIDWSMVKAFSPALILEHRCFPIKRDDRSIVFAITNPLDAWTLKKAEEESRGLAPKFVLVTAKDMKETIQRYEEYIRGYISSLFK